MSTSPLVLASAPLPLLPQTELIGLCRKLLIESNNPWLFLSSPTEFVVLQMPPKNPTPLSQSQSIIQEVLSPFIPHIKLTTVEPTLGHLQRHGQNIPVAAHTTIVRYHTTPGNRSKVVDECRELFTYVKENEMDVYSLCIMLNLEKEDEFISLERYKSREAEKEHLDSEKRLDCLKRIQGMIVGQDSRSCVILEV